MPVRRIVTLVTTVLLASMICLAQLETATILGTVYDSSKAVIPGAKVVVTDIGTSATVELTTDRSGTFIAPALRIGNYKVTVSATGFKTFVQTDITVNVNARVNLDVVLPPGSASQEVTIVGQTPVVQTASTTLGAVVDNQEAADLPLNGRDISMLTSVAPGTVPLGNRAFSGAGEGRLWENATRYLVDGGDSSQVDSDFAFGGYGSSARLTRASVDAVQEFRMASDSYSAEYGAAVGGVVNFITKSGTNRFHGDVFEFFRNDKLNARNWFDPAPSLKPEDRLNQFGGTLGGPIIRDKLFFFADYEAVRERTGVSFSTFTPTQAYRNSLTDPALLPAINQLPLPNGAVVNDPLCPNCEAAYNGSRVNDLTEDSFMGKIDWQATAKDRFTFRYSADPSTTLNYNGVGDGQYSTIPGRPQLVNINYTRVFNPNLLNEFGAHLNREYWDDPAGAGNYAPNSIRQTPLVVFGSGIANAGPTYWDMNVANTLFDFQDALTWIKGRHQLKFGAQIVHMANDKLVREQVWEVFLGLDGAYGATPPAGEPADFGAYATNTPYLLYNEGWPRPSVRIGQNAFFVQDDFKASSHLNLNMGLRYQYDGAPTEQHGIIANFDEQTGTLDKPGTTVFDAPKTEFAPRFGFAWSPFSAQKTVFRGGFGMFYSDFNSGYAQFLPTNVPGFAHNYEAVTSPAFPLVGFPATNISGLTGTVSPYSFNKDWKNAYTEAWNFNIQQGLGQNMVLQIGYVGNRGLHFSTTADGNPIDPATGQRGFPDFGEVTYYCACLITNYNALQVTFKRQLSNGLTFNVNYTFGKYLDDVGTSFGPTAVAQNPANPRGEYGPSDYDARHVLEFNYSYDLPMPHSFPGWLGGWQLNGITSMQSGQPITALCSCDPTGIGDTTGRADIVPGVPLYTGNPWPGSPTRPVINPAAFVTPLGTGQFGDSGRNMLRGPALLNWDFSVFKKFKVRESQMLEFRAEIFNLFNTPEFSNPSADVSAPATFGQSFSTITTPVGFPSQRQIQLALKYSF
jgi:hypothetical protein